MALSVTVEPFCSCSQALSRSLQSVRRVYKRKMYGIYIIIFLSWVQCYHAIKAINLNTPNIKDFWWKCPSYLLGVNCNQPINSYALKPSQQPPLPLPYPVGVLCLRITTPTQCSLSLSDGRRHFGQSTQVHGFLVSVLFFLCLVFERLLGEIKQEGKSEIMYCF